ncbi:hypothetical protein Syun_018546 [Stephania yunnanensis]|uniref:Myb/SANT-like domain-containing protein n=1 Tax=Stephania yunnanensis TaxID=152371 RepID=A0AAP0ISG8_9MAGN
MYLSFSLVTVLRIEEEEPWKDVEDCGEGLKSKSMTFSEEEEEEEQNNSEEVQNQIVDSCVILLELCQPCHHNLFLRDMDQPGSLESHIRSGGSFQPPRKILNTSTRPSKLLQQCAGAATKKRGQGKGRCSREASHEDSTDNSKTSRRKWSHAEDVALVNAMVEMVASGVYKCDNGFKPGYLNHLEEALKITCPNSGIKARPHIEFRQKSLKKDWFIVNDMICDIRHGTSGFDFDSTSNMVTAPDDVWEDYFRCRIYLSDNIELCSWIMTGLSSEKGKGKLSEFL